MIIQTWNIEEVLLNPKKEELLDGKSVVGIDIGSRQSKAVLLHQDKIYAAITASDVDSQRTAQRLLNRLLKEANIEQGEIAAISGIWSCCTGFWRDSNQNNNRNIMSCDGRTLFKSEYQNHH